MSNWRQTDRKLRCWGVLAVAVSALLACAGWSAESKPESNAVPPVTPAPATQTPPAFRLKPGFRLELVAAEPMVIAPVAMAFDENGRLFVVEQPEAAAGSGTNAPAGRIRLLEDPEGEGKFRTSKVYADNLPQASAIACYGGGVFVMASSNLLYLKDSKTNGIADVRNVIFGGFPGRNRLGATAFPNNFNWGLDNQVHAASAGVAGLVPASSAPDAPLVSLTRADFAFDPHALTVCAEAGPAESGLCFDDWGRKFTCDGLRPLRSPRYEPRYLARNPSFPAPPPMAELAGPATTIYRLVPAASSLATMRSSTTNEAAVAVGPVTNVPVAAWLTNVQGCVVYRGNAFPSNYLGNVFVADPYAHLIHRFVVRETGLDFTASRAPDETNTEFLVASDIAFRPVQLVNGPDGALYVVDRRDGDTSGRIWRITPAGFTPPKAPRLGQATTYGLAATLAHPNGWHRDTAARLLYERRDPKAAAFLEGTLVGSRIAVARLHALHALAGLGALNQRQVLTALRDADPRVREHAVRLSEKLIQGGTAPDPVWSQLRVMSADPAPRVRYQLAFTVGEARRPGRDQVLAALLTREPNNPWMQAAVFSSLATGAGDLFVWLARDARVRRDPMGQEWLRRLAVMIGVRGLDAEVAQVLGFVTQFRAELLLAFPWLEALGEGLHRANGSLALADPRGRLQPFYDDAVNAVLNYSAATPLRINAMRLLGVGPSSFTNTSDVLLLQVGSGQPEAIQSAALSTLGRFDGPRLVGALSQRWHLLSPRLRSEAHSAMLARTNCVATVLDALESGRLDGTDLTSAQRNFLRTYRDPDLSQRALRLFGPVPGRRPDAVQRFWPALNLKGAPARGRDVFYARCAACHQRGPGALPLGPDLADAKLYGREKILTAVLEPYADVRDDDLAYAVETVEGEWLVGLLRDENPAAITLLPLTGDPLVLPRANIHDLQAQPWSLMPEGLENNLTPQNLADLLAYLIAAGP